jgi:hypothetical protein
MRNPPRPEACVRTLPPSPIESAIAAVTRLHGMPPQQRALLTVLLDYCVSHSNPGKRFRVTVKFLMDKTGRSKASVERDIAALRGAGWICRVQNKRGARRHGFKPGLTWLTPEALTALGFVVQRASPVRRKTKPASQWKRRMRVYKIPEDLKPLLSRLRPGQVVWLMREAKDRGKTLQTVLANGGMDAVLAADRAAGLVLQLLDGERRPRRWCAAAAPDATSGPGRGGDGVTGGAYVRAEQAHLAVAVFGAAARARRDAWLAARCSARMKV